MSITQHHSDTTSPSRSGGILHKALAIGIALVALLSLALVGGASPASARVEGDYFTKVACEEYTALTPSGATTSKTCFQANWSRQADGSGVTLNRFKVTTPVSCNRHETPAYKDYTITWINPGPGGQVNASYDESYFGTGCTLYRDNPGNGNDGVESGPMRIVFNGIAALDLASDKRVQIAFKVYPDGSSEILYTKHSDA